MRRRERSVGTPGVTGQRRAGAPGVQQPLLRLQRLAGNRAVQELLDLQRVVYLGQPGNWHRKTGKTWKGLVGSLSRESFLSMIYDRIPRFFPNKRMMALYAQGRTENMGYVAAEGTWAKADRFTVIGEDHTATTLPHIAGAFRTDRFRYEPYAENVPATTNAALNQAVRARAARADAEVRRRGYRPGRHRHEAEDLRPKIVRGLEGIADHGSPHVVGVEAEIELFRWAILDAASNPTHQHLAHYLAHRQQFDQVAERLANPSALTEWGGMRRVTDLTRAEFTAFKRGYVQFAQEHIDAARVGIQQEWTDFQQGWHLVDRPLVETGGGAADYKADPNHPLMRAERERDFSLFRHIKAARDDGDILFGMGEFHEKRLFDLLDAEGIHHRAMSEFIADQRARFVRPP